MELLPPFAYEDPKLKELQLSVRLDEATLLDAWAYSAARWLRCRVTAVCAAQMLPSVVGHFDDDANETAGKGLTTRVSVAPATEKASHPNRGDRI